MGGAFAVDLLQIQLSNGQVLRGYSFARHSFAISPRIHASGQHPKSDGAGNAERPSRPQPRVQK